MYKRYQYSRLRKEILTHVCISLKNFGKISPLLIPAPIKYPVTWYRYNVVQRSILVVYFNVNHRPVMRPEGNYRQNEGEERLKTRGIWDTNKRRGRDRKRAERKKVKKESEDLLFVSSARSRRHASGPPPLIIDSLLISANEPRASSMPAYLGEIPSAAGLTRSIILSVLESSIVVNHRHHLTAVPE